MHVSKSTPFALALFGLLIGTSGCGDKQPAGGGANPAATATAPTAALPASLALASEPAGAKLIGEIVAGLAASGPVVARGRVGVEGSTDAYFTLADPSLKDCVTIGDHCPTPWDYCCTPADEMAKQSATVEFHVGGKRASGSVIGFHGIDHLKEVVVTGEATKDDAGNVTIVASGIWVKP